MTAERMPFRGWNAPSLRAAFSPCPAGAAVESLRLPLSSAAHRPITGASLQIGGTELREGSAESLRSLITVVSFNSYIFGGSVRSTLLEGRPDADESALQEVLRRVNLLDFVQSQGGLDMP